MMQMTRNCSHLVVAQCPSAPLLYKTCKIFHNLLRNLAVIQSNNHDMVM